MKKLLALLILVALAVSVQAQLLVTNNNIELVWSQGVDDALRAAWKTDNFCRTNGIMPYGEAMASITYKQFLTEQVSWQVTQKISEFSAKYQQIQEQIMLNAIRSIQATNPVVFKRLWNIAVKGTE